MPPHFHQGINREASQGEREDRDRFFIVAVEFQLRLIYFAAYLTVPDMKNL
jgi:hypothetical protein